MPNICDPDIIETTSDLCGIILYFDQNVWNNGAISIRPIEEFDEKFLSL